MASVKKHRDLAQERLERAFPEREVLQQNEDGEIQIDPTEDPEDRAYGRPDSFLAREANTIDRASYTALASTCRALARQNEQLTASVPKSLADIQEASRAMLTIMSDAFKNATTQNLQMMAQIGEILQKREEREAQQAMALERRKQLGRIADQVVTALPSLTKQLGGSKVVDAMQKLKSTLTLKEIEVFEELAGALDNKEAGQALKEVLSTLKEGKEEETAEDDKAAE